jgi:AcrR family transcriptional regulator
MIELAPSEANRRPVTDLKEEVAALKRERIVGAAADLIYDRGYENTTLDAVSEHIGVTKPFIYSYFKSKTEILAEICSRGIKASLEAINSVSTEPDEIGVEEKLRLLSERFVKAVLENQKYIAIFSREEKNLDLPDFNRISDYRRKFDRKLTALLDEGVASGVFQPIDTNVAALAIGGLVSWAYVWYRPHGRLTLDELSAQMAEMILSLVGARGASGKRATPRIAVAANPRATPVAKKAAGRTGRG